MIDLRSIVRDPRFKVLCKNLLVFALEATVPALIGVIIAVVMYLGFLFQLSGGWH